MNSRLLIIMAVFLLVALPVIISCEKKNTEVAQEPMETETFNSEGAKLFKKHCEVCHGAGGTGNIGPDLTDSKWRYGSSDEDIYTSISEGRPGGMPKLGNQLGKESIRELTTYIRSIEGK